MKQFSGHLLGANSVGFSPDGSRVATGDLQGESIKLFDWETGSELLTLASEAGKIRQEIRFSEDGSLLFFSLRVPTVHLAGTVLGTNQN